MNPPLTSERPIETARPREIGAHMASLRAQFNLTPTEVSERLHIRTRYINAIEDGRYELMPGKVYARGYVHSYAEFLGLNPEQIVAQCFAGEPSAVAAAIPLRPSTRTSSGYPMGNSSWRGAALLGAAALGILFVGAQFIGRGSDEQAAAITVAPVPEAMLASVRNQVMPMPDNYDCLTSDSALACFYSGKASHELDALMNESHLRFVGDIDVSALIVPPPEEEPPEEKADDAKPADGEPASNSPAPTDAVND